MELALSDVLAARTTISGSVIRTPLLPCHALTARSGAPFFLKMESMQPTGAFKLRGATNAAAHAGADIDALTCCSTGNHGRGVAFAAHKLGLKAIVCMSSLVPQTKIDGITALGAEVRIIGNSQDDALAECQNMARRNNIAEISPFDDPHVIAGQGTIGLEILEDVPDLKTLLVPLSGGGLASGVALAAKAINPQIEVIGLSMDRGAAMKASLDAGHPVEVTEVPSLADSLGGGIGLSNRLSFQMCRELLDEVIVVSEGEIYRAMQMLYFEEGLVAEGASVVGIAALLAGKLGRLKGPTAALITGRNVDMDQFTNVIAGQSIQLGSLRLGGSSYAA